MVTNSRGQLKDTDGPGQGNRSNSVLWGARFLHNSGAVPAQGL